MPRLPPSRPPMPRPTPSPPSPRSKRRPTFGPAKSRSVARPAFPFFTHRRRALPPIMALPLPDPDAQAHSDRLTALIADQIHAAGGWISFARYLELVLYAPGLGYYSAGSRK